jgi:hypothetical protein
MSAKLTVQDLLSKSDRVFKPKVAALVSTSASFQANDGFEQAMILHNNAVSVKEGLEMLTTDVSVCFGHDLDMLAPSFAHA